jgi:hypothetical protein
MGNLPSVIEPIQNSTKNFIKTDDSILNKDEIFAKISNISYGLLMEYNNEFLKEDFCNKLSIIYEKKISNFSIKLLKNLYDNINSKNIDNELLLTLQYIPEENDEFFTDTYNDNLKDNFWKEKIDFDPDLLKSNIPDIDINQIKSSVKYLPYYINPNHVNNLLESINKINNNLSNIEPKINNIEPKVGGFDNSKIKIVDVNSEYNKGKQFLNKLEITPTETHDKQILFNRGLKLHKSKEEITDFDISNKKIKDKNLEQYFKNNTIDEKSLNPTKNASDSANNSKPQHINPTKNVSDSANNSKPQHINPTKNASDSANNSKPQNINPTKNASVSVELEHKKNDLDHSIEKMNIVTNKVIAKNLNISDEKVIDDKVINNYIKYFVPKYYQKPKSFCSNMEKCKLSKKDLCSAITENFIVRNNIIAAILTTIPYKNKDDIYEGGICFQKFMNLINCNVCVPYDYRELKNQDIKHLLKKILEKADNLDETKCKDNHGYFLKLSNNEMQILGSKILNISEKDINNYPKIKYNYYFYKFSKKLQNTYLKNLNLLIAILEKLKETPIINNTTLNLISDETKKIIDNMYNTCHYYYIYGIISLINSDISEDILYKDNLANIVSDALEK